MQSLTISLDKISLGLLVVSVFLGAVPIISRKGKELHRIFGRLFFMIMVAASVGAIVSSFISFNRPATLLGLVSFAAIYVGLTGVRSTKMKRPDKKSHHQPNLLDWAITLVFLGGCAVFALKGLTEGEYLSEVVSLVAVMMAFFGLFDIYLFTRKFVKVRHGMTWLYKHLGRMLTSYSLSMTAMIGLYYEGVPNFFWLAPVVGILLLTGGFLWFYQSKYGV